MGGIGFQSEWRGWLWNICRLGWGHKSCRLEWKTRGVSGHVYHCGGKWGVVALMHCWCTGSKIWVGPRGIQVWKSSGRQVGQGWCAMMPVHKLDVTGWVTKWSILLWTDCWECVNWGYLIQWSVKLVWEDVGKWQSQVSISRTGAGQSKVHKCHKLLLVFVAFVCNRGVGRLPRLARKQVRGGWCSGTCLRQQANRDKACWCMELGKVHTKGLGFSMVVNLINCHCGVCHLCDCGL